MSFLNLLFSRFRFRQNPIKKRSFDEAEKCIKIISSFKEYDIKIYIKQEKDTDSRYVLYDTRICDIILPDTDKFNRLNYDFYLCIYGIIENPLQEFDLIKFVEKYNLENIKKKMIY
jgi:hypothetical protein